MAEHSNAHCPVCGSENCEGCEIDVFPSGCKQPCFCLDCGADWVDVYGLLGCEDIEFGGVA